MSRRDDGAKPRPSFSLGDPLPGFGGRNVVQDYITTLNPAVAFLDRRLVAPDFEFVGVFSLARREDGFDLLERTALVAFQADKEAGLELLDLVDYRLLALHGVNGCEPPLAPAPSCRAGQEFSGRS